MLSFAIILAIVSTAFEMIIASKWTWWREKAAHSLLVCGLGSVLLSYALGTLFGGHGLIAMTAGVMSTVMSACCYPILNYWLKHKEAISNTTQKLHNSIDSAAAAWQRNRQTLKDLCHLLMVIARFLTFPFRLIRWITDKYSNATTSPTPGRTPA